MTTISLDTGTLQGGQGVEKGAGIYELGETERETETARPNYLGCAASKDALGSTAPEVLQKCEDFPHVPGSQRSRTAA